MTQTHIHRFRNGTIAKAIVGPDGFAVEWSNPPDQTILPEYFRWRESILADFTKRTGKRVLVVTLV